MTASPQPRDCMFELQTRSDVNVVSISGDGGCRVAEYRGQASRTRTPLTDILSGETRTKATGPAAASSAAPSRPSTRRRGTLVCRGVGQRRHPVSDQLKWFSVVLLLLGLVECSLASELSANSTTNPTALPPEGFVAWSPESGFTLPPIVLAPGLIEQADIDWAQVDHPRAFHPTPPIMLGRAARYLQDGLKRMTGQSFPIKSRDDVTTGFVLVLFDSAPEDIRTDPGIRRGLLGDPDDPYANTEAFCIRCDPSRVLLVANNVDGLCHAVVELLESVDYEVLGMGPGWIHAPDYSKRPLVLNVNLTGRPSFYIRQMSPGSGQVYGMGTIIDGLTDPADETVDVSYWRWMIGRHLYGKSMPAFPGHALQNYRAQVVDHMRTTGSTAGFLSARTLISSLAERPAADRQNLHWMWINVDPHVPALKAMSYSDGQTWHQGFASINLDLSVPFIRQFVLENMIEHAAAVFEKHPDQPVIFGIDATDGARGNAFLAERMKNPSWYPRYREQERLPFGRTYVLHDHNGLNQPSELWDPAAASDNMFGLAGWLLHEFDKWADALPVDQQVTATGRSKKELIRCSFYSYNYHDVPPNFNPDARIRVMIAGYAKHRGVGKWEKFTSHEAVAEAFQIMLPREPSGDYRIMSLAKFRDHGPNRIPASRNASPSSVARDFRRSYDVGFRAMSIEIDFNFGKYGLAYYLVSKMLWNAELTAAELDAIRDRWFRRAFGRAWREMKTYYDFMLTDNYPVNAPRTWGQAIRLIDAADKKLNGAHEPAAQRRLDDVKQYWYYHYLADSGKFTRASPEFKTFLWKGQMSYMVPMVMVAHSDFEISFAGNRNAVKDVVGPETSAGSAQYTLAETQAWWTRVLDHWSVTKVQLFADVTLADGRPAQSVDLNDLVQVQQFQDERQDTPFFYNSGPGYRAVPFLMVAQRKDAPLGFRLAWPFRSDNARQAARKLPYGVEIWDPASATWERWVDQTMVSRLSERAADASGKEVQVVTVQLKAPRAGTYRFNIGPGGDQASLGSLAFEPSGNRKYRGSVGGFTYFTQATGFTQPAAYIYIPKGTASLDLEVWDHRKGKFIQLYTGLPASNSTPTRQIDVSAMGTHTIKLKPGEDGTIAAVTGNLFAFPYLYSIPTLWAKSPSALLIPRGIADADGLSTLE